MSNKLTSVCLPLMQNQFIVVKIYFVSESSCKKKLLYPHFSIKATENLFFLEINRGYLIFTGVRLIFISLMNTKSGVFTRGEATREIQLLVFIR